MVPCCTIACASIINAAKVFHHFSIGFHCITKVNGRHHFTGYFIIAKANNLGVDIIAKSSSDKLRQRRFAVFIIGCFQAYTNKEKDIFFKINYGRKKKNKTENL